MTIAPHDLLTFWFDEVGWFGWNDSLDRAIRARFASVWNAARDGGLPSWATEPSGALALAILLDQFPRSMLRGSSRAFASDPQARAVAEKALESGWDLAVSERERMFFYLPLGHSESLADQDRALRLVEERMPDLGRMYLPHVRAHRGVIRRFGRFPMRNDALGRQSTPEEKAFLNGGGYEQLVIEMETQSA
nr:DUF924 family protein [Rubellimicrobium aerolatum]